MSALFPNAAAEFTYVRSYSRWLEDEKRRETWPETVARYVDFLRAERGHLVPEYLLNEIEEAIVSFRVMPSMRALWAAGGAARVEHVTMYNCAAAAIDSVDAFAECLYILMCGAGFGFDVTQESISKVPVVPSNVYSYQRVHTIKDSREGWADSIKVLMNGLYSGIDTTMDYSSVRPKGSRLKTMGGRASGPEPLLALHDFIRDTFVAARGRRLKSIECHDICNKIAEIVVVGGVRRSSEISLSDLQDEDLCRAKIWPFPAHRSMANNSVVYKTKPTEAQFWAEWQSLEASGTGERGIFNLEAARAYAPERRQAQHIQLVNPCGEIPLRSMQFCNLSEVVVRLDDTLATLTQKVKLATAIGAVQSTFTDFPYLRPQWKDNCDEERLLGVSLTGIMDAPHLLTAKNLRALKAAALSTAAEMAEALGVPMSASVTCVKPSGTVSQLVNSASGMHPRYARHYVRRYRISAMDPLFHMMSSQGFEFVPEVGQKAESAQTWVVEFPVASPAGSVCREAVSAVDQLELYKLLQENYSEHNSSLTVYCRPGDWKEVGLWVWQNWDMIKGISFLPYDSGHYELAPYQACSKTEYEALVAKTPEIDYSQLSYFEQADNTEGSKTAACLGGSCEI